PPSGLLVRDERFETDVPNRRPTASARLAGGPRLLPGDAADLRHEVDLMRHAPDLQDLVLFDDVLGRDVRGRKAERGDRLKHTGHVLPRGADQEIEVSRESRRAVESDGKPANDQEVNFLRGQ